MIIDKSREHIYQGFTLVDITNTEVTKFSLEHEKARNQQRNWETVQQIIGLRSQIFDIKQVELTETVKKHKFGNLYKGKHHIWMFEFAVEFEDVFKINSDPVGVLVRDFHQAPVVMHLNETASAPMPLFYTDGENKNIYFKTLL